MRSRAEARAHAAALNDAESITLDLVGEHLRGFILCKYLLDEDECAGVDDLEELVVRSLAKSMAVAPELVVEFDTAQSCSGTTSAMAKRNLLIVALEKELGIQLPPIPCARAKTVTDLSWVVFEAMAKAPCRQDESEGC